jgi:hypothetical protein
MKEAQCKSCNRTIVNPGMEYAQCDVCTVCMPQYEDIMYKLSWQDKLICAIFRNASRSHTNGHGSDPYSGETYSLKIGKLGFEVSNVVCYKVSITWNGKSIYWVVKDSSKEFNWFGRKMIAIADTLERKYQLMYQCDEYGSLTYYE